MRYIIVIFLLINAHNIYGQSFLSKYSNINNENADNFFSDWEQWSDSIKNSAGSVHDSINIFYEQIITQFINHDYEIIDDSISLLNQKNVAKDFSYYEKNYEEDVAKYKYYTQPIIYAYFYDCPFYFKKPQIFNLNLAKDNLVCSIIYYPILPNNKLKCLYTSTDLNDWLTNHTTKKAEIPIVSDQEVAKRQIEEETLNNLLKYTKLTCIGCAAQCTYHIWGDYPIVEFMHFYSNGCAVCLDLDACSYGIYFIPYSLPQKYILLNMKKI